MEWQKIPDRSNARLYLPTRRPFLVLWKGTVCLCEYDDEIDHFYMGTMPASYLGFWKLDKERESKITHWCELEMPEDY